MKRIHTKMSRRSFLRLAGGMAAVTALAAGTPALLKACRSDQDQETAAGYLATHKEQILKNFNATLEYVKAVLARKYDVELAETLIKETGPAVEALLPQVPYIGGDKNDLTQNLVQSAGALAFYRVMQAHGKSAEETGQILYEAFDAQTSDAPRLVRAFFSSIQNAWFVKDQSRDASKVSHQEKYPEDWVFDYVEGDGQDFDWGIDYTECGVCKFYHAQGADELAPYLCQLDFPISKAFNMGLVRTQTIAQGGKLCDFRWKKDRETQPGWPPPFME